MEDFLGNFGGSDPNASATGEGECFTQIKVLDGMPREAEAGSTTCEDYLIGSESQSSGLSSGDNGNGVVSDSSTPFPVPEFQNNLLERTICKLHKNINSKCESGPSAEAQRLECPRSESQNVEKLGDEEQDVITEKSAQDRDACAHFTQKRLRKPTLRYIDESPDRNSRYSKERQKIAASTSKDKFPGVRRLKNRDMGSRTQTLSSNESFITAIQVPFDSQEKEECQMEHASISVRDINMETPPDRSKRDFPTKVMSPGGDAKRRLCRVLIADKGSVVRDIEMETPLDWTKRDFATKVMSPEGDASKQLCPGLIGEKGSKVRETKMKISPDWSKHETGTKVIEDSGQRKHHKLWTLSEVQNGRNADMRPPPDRSKRDSTATVMSQELRNIDTETSPDWLKHESGTTKMAKSSENKTDMETSDWLKHELGGTTKTGEEDSGSRKHHKLWTLAEVRTLIDGVSHYGVGRWTKIKRLLFSSSPHRTPVDLKDKWRNLLKASCAEGQSQKEDEKRRNHPWRPLPKSVLQRVSELAIVYPYPRDEKSKLSKPKLSHLSSPPAHPAIGTT